MTFRSLTSFSVLTSLIPIPFLSFRLSMSHDRFGRLLPLKPTLSTWNARDFPHVGKSWPFLGDSREERNRVAQGTQVLRRAVRVEDDQALESQIHVGLSQEP